MQIIGLLVERAVYFVLELKLQTTQARLESLLESGKNIRNSIVNSTARAAINLLKRSKGFVRELSTRQEINSHFDKTFPPPFFFFYFS